MACRPLGTSAHSLTAHVHCDTPFDMYAHMRGKQQLEGHNTQRQQREAKILIGMDLKKKDFVVIRLCRNETPSFLSSRTALACCNVQGSERNDGKT